MTRQDQDVGAGGEAYQAGGNLTVVKGMSPGQMLELLDAVGGMITRYVAEADEKWQQRFNKINEDIVAKFSDPSEGADPEALADPDFQFVIREAQNAYGRSGEEGLRLELVKLLAARSKEKQRTRRAMLLNDAIAVVGKLTPQEISALVMLFLFRHVGIKQPTYSAISEAFAHLSRPFIKDFPPDDFSYEYLESSRCVTVNQISHVNLWDGFVGQFGFMYTEGFFRAEFDQVVNSPGQRHDLSAVVEPIPGNYTGRLRFNVARHELEQKLTAMGDAILTGAVLSLFDTKAFDRERIQQEIFRAIPGFEQVSKYWETTAVRQSNLTALGKVVAHSALTSRTPFNASLDIWAR